MNPSPPSMGRRGRLLGAVPMPPFGALVGFERPLGGSSNRAWSRTATVVGVAMVNALMPCPPNRPHKLLSERVRAPIAPGNGAIKCRTCRPTWTSFVRTPRSARVEVVSL